MPQGTRFDHLRYSQDVIRVPQRIDIAQQQTCPVCQSGFDGLVCPSCGFEAPPKGLEDPNTDKSKQQENPLQDQNNNSQFGEDMSRSRFNDLLSGNSGASVASRYAKMPNPPKYDQRSTINLDSGFGPGEDAPAPVSDDDFDLESYRGRPKSNVLDLDEKDVTGRPGDNNIGVRSSKAASRRLARILTAQLDELIEEAGSIANQVQQALQSLGADSGNGQTSSDLGAIDDQLAQLQSTLGEMAQVAQTEVAPPEAQGPQLPPGDPSGTGAPQVDPSMAQAARKISKRVTKSRRLLRKAYEVLSDDTLPDEDADEEVNDLIDELEDEVRAIDEDVDNLDGAQDTDDSMRAAQDDEDSDEGDDDESDFSPEDESGDEDDDDYQGDDDYAGNDDQGTFAKKRALKARKTQAYKRNQMRKRLLANLRSARKHLARVAYLQKFADEDEVIDEQVEDELQEVQDDLQRAQSTADQLADAQQDDIKESHKKGLFHRSNKKVTPSQRIARSISTIEAGLAKIAEGDSDYAREDFDKADDELEKAEKDVHEDEERDKDEDDAKKDDRKEDRDDDDSDDDDKDDDKKEARRRVTPKKTALKPYRRNSRRVTAEEDEDDDDDSVDDDFSDDDDDSVDDYKADAPNKNIKDPVAPNGSGVDDGGREARRRTIKRRAAEDPRSVHKWTDVQDLDSGAPKTKEQLMNPKRVNVLDPVEEGNQLERADTPERFNDGTEAGFDDQNPPSRSQWPYENPDGYAYKRSGKEQLFHAMRLADQMVRIGMTDESNKFRHIAEFENMHPEKLAGYQEMLDKIEKTGRTASAPKKILSNASRIPSLGRSTAPSSYLESEDLITFL